MHSQLQVFVLSNLEITEKVQWWKKVLFPFHKTCNILLKENKPKLCLYNLGPNQNFKTPGRRWIMSDRMTEGRIIQQAHYKMDQWSRWEAAVMRCLSYSCRRTPVAPRLQRMCFPGGFGSSCSVLLQFQATKHLGMPGWAKRMRVKYYFCWVDFDKISVDINGISQVSCSCLGDLGLMTWCFTSLHSFATDLFCDLLFFLCLPPRHLLEL